VIGAERQVQLAPRPSSAAAARRIVKRELRDIDPSARDVGVLLASELVTNALLYARGDISLHISESEDWYRIGVWDASPVEVHRRHVGLDATSGRGLALVERLAQSWGVDVRDPDGKEVWFKVPRHA